MQIKTPQVKLALRIEAATVEDDVLVLRGLAGFLPCEARITAPELRHLSTLLRRREALRSNLDPASARIPDSTRHLMRAPRPARSRRRARQGPHICFSSVF